MPDHVTLGRTVLYRSRTGQYTVPAIVNCTARSINPAGVQAGNVPPLSSEQHVHLSVQTPGIPGKRQGAPDFVVGSDYPVSENVAGTYQEWDIPFWEPAPHERDAWDGGDYAVQPAATWAWPQRLSS